MLNLNMSPMVKGILIGVGVSAVGFYAYKHNEEKVDNFLRSHGVKVKTPTAGFETMSVEDLMRTKESIEQAIQHTAHTNCKADDCHILKHAAHTAAV